MEIAVRKIDGKAMFWMDDMSEGERALIHLPSDCVLIHDDTVTMEQFNDELALQTVEGKVGDVVVENVSASDVAGVKKLNTNKKKVKAKAHEPVKRFTNKRASDTVTVGELQAILKELGLS